MAKRRVLNMALANETCQKFIMGYLNEQVVGLPKDMTEADFSTTMDAVVKAMRSAYSAGYVAGLEQP